VIIDRGEGMSLVSHSSLHFTTVDQVGKPLLEEKSSYVEAQEITAPSTRVESA